MFELRRVPIFTLAAILVLILASSATRGYANAASPAVDQQCTAIAASFLDGLGVHQPAGQTFIPMESSLVGFALFLWSENPTATSMTANIISNGIAGVNGIQSSIVGSVTFDVPAYFGQPTGAWLNVPLPSGVVLTPGAVYALNLVDNSESPGIKWSACSTPYGNGCGYVNGQCQANSWAFEEYYGDFSVAFSTTGLTVAQGASASVSVYINSLNKFASPVSLTFSTPPGVTASFNDPSNVETSAGALSSPTVTIFVSGSVAPGPYPFKVIASSGALSHSTTLQLIVAPTGTIISPMPDFAAQPSPQIITLTPGVSKTTTITIYSVNGFAAAADLTASWRGAAPSGVSVNLPSPVSVASGGSASSTLTLTADNSPSTGTFSLLVTATSGGVSHSIQLSVNVAGAPSVLAPVTLPDFSLATTSNTVSVIQGLSAGTSVVVSSLGGFNSPIQFSASWVGDSPTGIGVAIPQSVTPPSGGAASTPLQFTTTATGSTGTYVLQVTGTSGSTTHSTDINLQVSSPGSQCIIATATYGSAMAPQVQLLRNFRDNSILRTKAGSSFMLAFNAWYYSFSPSVANQIAGVSILRTAMQGLLYPMIGILGLSARVYAAASGYPELAIVLAGLLASSMLGAVYFGIPAGLIRGRVKRLQARRTGSSLEKLFIAAATTSLVVLGLGELVGSSLVLMMSASTLVLSTTLLSSTAVSNRLAGFLTGGLSQ